MEILMYGVIHIFLMVMLRYWAIKAKNTRVKKTLVWILLFIVPAVYWKSFLGVGK